jgi:hypothetical protein
MDSILLKTEALPALVPAWLILLMAGDAGATVAKIYYYYQPILKEIL